MLEVIEAGLIATVQDLGRYGFRQFGVPVSGAVDSFALRAANALVGNPPEAAALEIGVGGAAVAPADDCLVAATGAGFDLLVRGRRAPLWMSLFVRRNWEIRLVNNRGGGWAYLAAAGGFGAPPVLGSRSTYLRGGFGGHEGRALRAGDALVVGRSPHNTPAMAGRHVPNERRPGAYDESSKRVVEVVLGPQWEWFTERGRSTFLSSEYAVTFASDRMGYRLQGPAIERRAQAEMISDGMAAGAVQVPADGQPMVMMSDGATAGGYPKIAVVASADLPAVAQCPPGTGRLRFRATTVEAAQDRLRAMLAQLPRSILDAGGEEEYFV